MDLDDRLDADMPLNAGGTGLAEEEEQGLLGGINGGVAPAKRTVSGTDVKKIVFRHAWKAGAIIFVAVFLVILVVADVLAVIFVKTNDETKKGVYGLVSINESAHGWQGQIEFRGDTRPERFGADVAPLKIVLDYETPHRLRMRIFDPKHDRWEVPGVVLPKENIGLAMKDTEYIVEKTNKPFGVTIKRRSNEEVLFDTTIAGMVFENNFIEFASSLPNNPNIYGLGERVKRLRLEADGSVYTMWNQGFECDEVEKSGYGSHPFYLDMRESGAHGVFLLNSNAMDVVLVNNRITYKIIGGVIDAYFFLGPTPGEVVAQYQELIGYPYMPPFWALGFSQSRWGYANISELQDVVANYKKYDIPLEVMWSDIDYMDKYRDFTTDPENYPTTQLAAFVSDLHTNNQRYVCIVDPGIHVEEGYAPYDKGCEYDVWIKNKDGGNLLGRVWPGLVYYPDFTHPNASAFWGEQISGFHDAVEFDGLWLDMNEASNYCDGECPEESSAGDANTVLGDGGFDPDNPPYVPGGAPLVKHAISPSARGWLGQEFDVHNMYGFHEQKVTVGVLEEMMDARAFTLTRSSFAGSGRHGFKWLGDNLSQYSDMSLSIPGMLAMNMFGISLVGADVCGFGLDANAELCTRWIELGAFYPFCRNHNEIGSVPQELYRWGETAIETSRKMLHTRYSLFSYYYSLFERAHYAGETVVRPLFFEFPEDTATYGLDDQFMIGPALMLAPALEKEQRVVNAYLPAGRWWNFFSMELLAEVVEGRSYSLKTPLNSTNLLLRGGSVVPVHASKYSLTETRETDVALVVALCPNDGAKGRMYLDDGAVLAPRESGKYTEIDFFVDTTSIRGRLSAPVQYAGFSTDIKVTSATVVGLHRRVEHVVVNGGSVPFAFDEDRMTLRVDSLTLGVASAFSVEWFFNE